MEKEYTGDLILLRGVPGSGKTTLGEAILKSPQATNNLVLSADDFFMDNNGNYNFDATKLKQAHNMCQQTCAEAMKNGSYKIVVANTFTQEWEMKPYFEMAEYFEYKVFSIVVENRHGGVNKHNVPEETLTSMRNRFEINL